MFPTLSVHFDNRKRSITITTYLVPIIKKTYEIALNITLPSQRRFSITVFPVTNNYFHLPNIYLHICIFLFPPVRLSSSVGRTTGIFFPLVLFTEQMRIEFSVVHELCDSKLFLLHAVLPDNTYNKQTKNI